MKTGPCKGCDKRYVGCHSVCDVYNEWNDEHVAEREARGESLKIALLATSGVFASKSKSHRAKNPATFKEGKRKKK